jgi:hypothetical protein
MDPITNEVVINEDAELDAELNATLESIKTGKESPAPVAEVKPEVEPKVEEPSTPPEVKPEYEFTVPKKGANESDESFEKRIELSDLIKKRKLAKSDDQKQTISDKIQETRKDLFKIGLTEKGKITNPLPESEVIVPEEDESIRADRERLQQLGGATKEDLIEVLKQERQAAEVQSTLKSFVDRYGELKDEDTREVFFDFVDSNYNWQNKSGRELMTVLELARESMFKPSESISERVLAGANVQEKVNAMQFPGGTVITKTAMSPEVKQSVSELMATGMSEAKALELLSD